MKYQTTKKFFSFSSLKFLIFPVFVAVFSLKSLATLPITPPFKIVDASNAGVPYFYGASTILVDGTYYSYSCSTGSGRYDWDHIRLSTSQDLINWSSPIDLLTSTKVERANCDPSIVQYDAGDGLYYYLIYSGNAVNVQTLNFIARSPSPAGPFLKYTDRGTWEHQPNDSAAIIWPAVTGYGDKSGVYGAGQASIVVQNGVVYQWYTDTTAQLGINRIYLSTSTDMIHWSPAIATNIYKASIDVKFYDVLGEFVLFGIENEHQPNASMVVHTSKDGINWSEAHTICDTNCFPDWSNNIGVSSDRYGHIQNGQTLVTYGAPYDLSGTYNNDCGIAGKRNCWGYWDLYGQIITVNMTAQSNVPGSIQLNCPSAIKAGSTGTCTIIKNNVQVHNWFVNEQIIPQCANQASCSSENIPAGSYNIQVIGVDPANQPVVSSVVRFDAQTNPSSLISLNCDVPSKAGQNASCSFKTSGNFVAFEWFVNELPVQKCHNHSSCSWSNVEAGNYQVYVKGYNESGTTVSSSNIIAQEVK